MVSLLSGTDCNSLATGEGLATTWTLTGGVTYSGQLNTDGYKLKAALVWKNGNAVSKKTVAETISASTAIGYGSCVATLDSAGKVPAATSTTTGNFAICHFFFYLATTSGTTSGTVQAPFTVSTAWGVTTYLTGTQWGTTTAGSGIVGNTMNNSTGGTGITTSNWGIVYSPTTATNSQLTADQTYSMEWYQPKWATTYKETELRRYGGTFNNSTADKVMPYCISQRLLSASTNFAQGIVAGTEKTMTGAFALAAGAVAFGVSALAI